MQNALKDILKVQMELPVKLEPTHCIKILFTLKAFLVLRLVLLVLLVQQPLDRAWRQVGLALEQHRGEWV
jgi:uncharacterized lipoprotein